MKMVHINSVAMENQLYVLKEVVIEDFLLEQHFYRCSIQVFQFDSPMKH